MILNSTNAFVVIPSVAKTDKLSVKEMLNMGLAEGFRGTVDRVRKQRFIVIIDKNEQKAYYADLLKVTEHINPLSKIPRVNVRFGIARDISWDIATNGLNLNGQANTRYHWLTGFHRC